MFQGSLISPPETILQISRNDNGTASVPSRNQSLGHVLPLQVHVMLLVLIIWKQRPKIKPNDILFISIVSVAHCPAAAKPSSLQNIEPVFHIDALPVSNTPQSIEYHRVHPLDPADKTIAQQKPGKPKIQRDRGMRSRKRRFARAFLAP